MGFMPEIKIYIYIYSPDGATFSTTTAILLLSLSGAAIIGGDTSPNIALDTITLLLADSPVVRLEISMSDVILNSYIFVIGLIFCSSDTSLAHSKILT